MTTIFGWQSNLHQYTVVEIVIHFVIQVILPDCYCYPKILHFLDNALH